MIYHPTPQEKKEIGKRIRELSEEKGIALRYMPERLGITPHALRSYLKGRNIPSTIVAIKCSEILEEPLENIFGDNLAEAYRQRAQSRDFRRTERKKNESHEGLQRMRSDREKSELSLDGMVKKIEALGINSRNFSATGLSQIENGIAELNIETALAYATVLGTDIDRYLEPEKEMVTNEKITSGVIPSSDRILDTSDIRIDLERAILTLTRNEREVIAKLYGFDYTLNEAGTHLNLSGQRISQIDQKALRKLKKALKTKSRRRQKSL